MYHPSMAGRNKSNAIQYFYFYIIIFLFYIILLYIFLSSRGQLTRVSEYLALSKMIANVCPIAEEDGFDKSE